MSDYTAEYCNGVGRFLVGFYLVDRTCLVLLPFPNSNINVISLSDWRFTYYSCSFQYFIGLLIINLDIEEFENYLSSFYDNV